MVGAVGRALTRTGEALQKRSVFKGAELSRLWFDWIASPISADQEIYNDFLRLRSRARELTRNSPLVRQYLAQLEANVIGADGFKFQALVRNANGQLNEMLNGKIESAWNDWAECVTADGQTALVDLQHLLIRNLATDGEVLVRKVRSASANDYRFALQHIDPDLLDHMFFRAGNDKENEVRLGVEIDAWGAPVAYWFWDRHPTDLFNVSARKRLRVPADEVIHVYVPERPNQTRGITWLNSIMMPLKMLDGYVEAELVAARTGAAKMGFFQWKDASDFEPPQADEKLTMNAEPGKMEMLPPGLEFKEWNPEHPSTAFPNFWKAIVRFIASGLRVSYNTLANDLEGVNYSSMRAGVLTERDQWRKLQKMWVRKFLRPIYREWIEFAILSGRLVLDGRDPAAWNSVRFLPRGWQWVDPLKDVNANIAAIENGLSSRSRIIAETGGDFEELAEELRDEQKMISEMGLQLSGLGIGAGPTAGDNPAQAADAAAEADKASGRGSQRGALRVISAARTGILTGEALERALLED
jgi:lambda family phage portal protein